MVAFTADNAVQVSAIFLTMLMNTTVVDIIINDSHNNILLLGRLESVNVGSWTSQELFLPQTSNMPNRVYRTGTD